jgi:multidrug efflux pump
LPILIVTIAGPVDEEELKKLGEDLEDDIKRIPGVLDAKLTGGREREIRVQVEPDRLAALRPVAGRRHRGDQRREREHSRGRRRSGVRELPAAGAGRVRGAARDRGRGHQAHRRPPVFVRDVARVVDGFADRASYARMNGEAAVSSPSASAPGANILQVADR